MFCSPLHQGRMHFQGFPLLLLLCVLCTLGSSTQCWCDSKYVSHNYALKVCMEKLIGWIHGPRGVTLTQDPIYYLSPINPQSDKRLLFWGQCQLKTCPSILKISVYILSSVCIIFSKQ